MKTVWRPKCFCLKYPFWTSLKHFSARCFGSSIPWNVGDSLQKLLRLMVSSRNENVLNAGLLNVFMEFNVSNLKALWRNFENGLISILKILSKRLQDALIVKFEGIVQCIWMKGAFKSKRRFMKNLRILNMNDLKALCRYFESVRPKPFKTP